MSNSGAWDCYANRIHSIGKTMREHTLNRMRVRYRNDLSRSLSYKEVLINGREQAVTIDDTRESMSIKKIASMPGESLEHGGIVDFANSKWLITELDADSELYSSGMIRRCNYLLKWVDDNENIIEKWCVVEDGTKYLIGEKAAKLMTIGDARIAVTIGKDADTNKLKRGMRFLIDDMDSENVLAYEITKPNKLFDVYNGAGVFRFILTEVNATDNDNIELRVADYYNRIAEDPGDVDRLDISPIVVEEDKWL